MLSRSRRNCRDVRLNFWKNWIRPDQPLPEAVLKRLDPKHPFPYWGLSHVPEYQEEIRVLDVNAGPVSAIGKWLEGREVNLTAIDELAPDLQELLEPHGVVAPVPTEFCAPEDALPTCGEGVFDLVYSYNGLDFTGDPVAVYRQLLRTLKPHGRIVTFHELVEDPQRHANEWFRWFHRIRNGRVMLQQKGYRRDLQDALPPVQLDWQVENGLLKLVLSHTEERSCEVRQPQAPNVEQGKVPPLLSMHLPKTAGSTFRAFLEDLYGKGLRCMYTEEETAPRLVQNVRIASEVQCLHGHFQADAFEHLLPGAGKVTWLRDPVERVISSYFQFLRHPESASESRFNEQIFSHRWSIMDFARSEEMRRQVLWYFNGVPLDDFLFVGITERFNESLGLLCRFLGLPRPASDPAANVNPGKHVGQRYALDPAQRRELEGLYAEEIELYQFANYRLSALLGNGE